MAFLADRFLYRLSALWWTAIYGGLSEPSLASSVRASEMSSFVPAPPPETMTPVAA